MKSWPYKETRHTIFLPFCLALSKFIYYLEEDGCWLLNIRQGNRYSNYITACNNKRMRKKKQLLPCPWPYRQWQFTGRQQSVSLQFIQRQKGKAPKCKRKKRRRQHSLSMPDANHRFDLARFLIYNCYLVFDTF
jgi:hypothetical protein